MMRTLYSRFRSESVNCSMMRSRPAPRSNGWIKEKLSTVVGVKLSLPENCQTSVFAKFATIDPPVVKAFCTLQNPEFTGVPTMPGGDAWVRPPRPTAPRREVDVLDVKKLLELPVLPGPVLVP